MILKTKGIVLRTQKYSETSLICRILTKEKGLKSYIISGVRKQNSRVGASLFQLMNILDLVVYDREEKDLNRIKEVKLHYVYQNIPYDIFKGTVGMFIIEIVQKTIKGQEEHTELYSYLQHLLEFLDQTKESISNVHLHFLLEYASYLGLNPTGVVSEQYPYFNLETGIFCGEAHQKFSLHREQSQVISDLMHLNVSEAHCLKLSHELRSATLKSLLKFYQIHIENLPEINSHKVLSDVLK